MSLIGAQAGTGFAPAAAVEPLSAPGTGRGMLTDLLERAPRIDLGALWTSPWLLMSLATVTILVALNAILGRRTFERNERR